MMMIFTSSAFAEITSFTNNRDFLLTKDGIKPFTNSGYAETNEEGKIVYTKDGYKLSYEKGKDNTWRAVETSRVSMGSTEEFSGDSQIVQYKSNKILSYTKCQGLDRKEIALVVPVDTRGIAVGLCVTGTSQVCDVVSKFGSSSEILDKVEQCQHLSDFQKNLKNVMASSKYKETRDKNVNELAASYRSLVHPKESLKDKILDRSLVNNATKPVESSIELTDTNNLLELAIVCERFKELDEGFKSSSNSNKNPSKNGVR